MLKYNYFSYQRIFQFTVQKEKNIKAHYYLSG